MASVETSPGLRLQHAHQPCSSARVSLAPTLSRMQQAAVTPYCIFGMHGTPVILSSPWQAPGLPQIEVYTSSQGRDRGPPSCCPAAPPYLTWVPGWSVTCRGPASTLHPKLKNISLHTLQKGRKEKTGENASFNQTPYSQGTNNELSLTSTHLMFKIILQGECG